MYKKSLRKRLSSCYLALEARSIGPGSRQLDLEASEEAMRMNRRAADRRATFRPDGPLPAFIHNNQLIIIEKDARRLTCLGTVACASICNNVELLRSKLSLSFLFVYFGEVLAVSSSTDRRNSALQS